jgi:putative PIG3 family NAD(P)H quinone oxidoreductase
MMSETMPAVLARDEGARGAWNELFLGRAPRPEVRAGEVLVQVEACSVNRADLLQRRGLYPPPPGASPILGLDFAGFLVSVSPEVERWHVGDRVFGIVPGGGYARYLTLPANQLLPIPPNLSFVEAAAAAEVFIAAHVSLFVEGGLMPAESVLIHGGGSGVGTAAIQLAQARGAIPLVTAGTDEKVGRCLELGARLALNYRSEDFEDAVMRFTGGAGVDVVLDWIGAPYLGRHLRLLKEKGRVVVIGLMGGAKAEIPLDLVVTKRLRVIGSVLRGRSDGERAGIIRAFEDEVLPWLRDGVVKPVVHAIFSMAEVEQAHGLLRASSHFGKVVLVWDTVRN